ncbi:WD repeat and coiled-coil-containing protein [Octodon degus]|uniref:WD repeat and coiled-coil-containing protein n=1 Tax=Octodon degus TaxID=10160 RepID=A0A6P6E361_OCTDE|nr:WD repeat and coiled-coil-containing protein [Octodon degus]XP_023566743.1 WD repeat and coiled-coil-containing protein [Octodon degus]XP_023566744.1 WD repeat and coiled-coil-containing protein [Octodon degus]XP_023566745.1 WD repeat and coiled-coil-containing protein [Octodon degus]
MERMKLGEGRLLRTRLNVLCEALHPTHGLAWTDGNQVVVTELQLHSGVVKFGDSRILGQFEHVWGVSWAPPDTAGVPALLAVQHKKHVTVWQLCPTTTRSSKWLMSQTAEIRESLDVLPQGCVWHPKNSVLTVLTAHDASVFPRVRCDNSRVKVDVGAQGRIHCACWTRDGQRLVVAVGSCLHSYTWDSAQKTLHRCSFCPLLNVDSRVCSIRATTDLEVAVTTELPLDKICSLKAAELIDVPTNGKYVGLHSSPGASEMSSADEEVAASETDCEIPVSPSISHLLDLTHLRFNPPQSEGSALICLRKKDYLTGTGQDSSHLVLVTFGKEVTMTRKVTIPGILVPDLIAFNVKTQVVAVASNTCNIILIYSVTPSSMPNIQHIQLENDERPKGISFVTDKLLLILVGKQKSTNSAFLPSSESDQYVIHLVVREVMLEEESSPTSNETQNADATCNGLLNKANRKKLIESLSPGFCHQNRELLITANTNSQGAKPGKTLIEEVESPPSSILDGSISLETPPRPSWAQGALPGLTSMPEPPNVPRREDLETVQLTKGLEVLSRSVTEMQQCLSELRDFLYSKKKSSPVYPLSKDPPYVHIIYQKPCCVGPVEKRAVLLCDGKLRLSVIQQMFGLSLVEMLHDSHWILLSADSEGFVPLTFTATQVLVVRDGSPRSSEVIGDSLSPSQDPVSLSKGSGDLAAQNQGTPSCPHCMGGAT